MQTKVVSPLFQCNVEPQLCIIIFFFTQLSGTFLCVNFGSKGSSLPYTSVVQCNLIKCSSDQRIVIFPALRNRNRFAEPTSVQIGIGIVCESQNLQIGIGILFVRWELFANYSQISGEKKILLYIILINSFSGLFIFFL